MDNALRTRIVKWHLPTAIFAFLKKNADYGDGHNEFGAKAQVIDIARKYKKIKEAVWDGKEMQHESVVELAQDLIGHCLLLIDQVSPPNEEHGAYEFSHSRWFIAYSDGMKRLFSEVETDG